VPKPARSVLTAPLRTLPAWWRSRSDQLQDGVLAAVFVAAAFAPPLAASGLALGELARHPLGVPGMVLALAQTLPLAVRRRCPALSLAVVAVAWRGWAWPTRWTMLALFCAAFADAIGSHYGLGGFFERLIALIGAGWIAAVAVGILRRSQQAGEAREAGPA